MIHHEAEVKRGKGVGEGTGPEGERWGGRMREKGWEERDFGIPMI